MKNYDAKKEWTRALLSQKIPYPSEYVIRIFKGNYPKLYLGKKSFKDKKICDVGFGYGPDFVVLDECGFKLFGTEITREIVDKVKNNLLAMGIKADLRVSGNADIPFADKYFDYLLSWNSCYYMGGQINFDAHIEEYARVMKPGATLVLSIPKKSCFIYKGSQLLKNGYRMIKNDPFGVRNGEVLRVFSGEAEIQKNFSPYFENFVFGSVKDDCFGYNYHWHLVVCQKK
jgi:SAM-dependent methyltransferase